MRQYQLQDYEDGGATCPECGVEFKGRSGLSKHHNAQHGEKFKPLAACDQCGQLYEETVGNLNTSGQTYCSESCRKSSWSESRSGEDSATYKEPVELTCDECGDAYERKPSASQSRFCSWECYSSWRAGKSFWDDNGTVVETCEWCDSQFERYRSHGSGRFCSPECQHKWMATRTGSDHPLYIGGVDYYRAVRRGLSETGWHTQRKHHLGKECELCGDSDVSLSLHHIVPVLSGGTNDGYNYMTLCRGCHSTVEAHTRDLPGMQPVLVE